MIPQHSLPGDPLRSYPGRTSTGWNAPASPGAPKIYPNCNDLQSSAARPDFIGQIRPTFDETVERHKPEISETQPGLFETDPQSSPLTYIP